MDERTFPDGGREEVLFRWSGQVMNVDDSIAYIGKNPKFYALPFPYPAGTLFEETGDAHTAELLC
ncbi:hypothetical protein BV378_20740 [Nostoc sp. RF31YmG]|nr:hypothetical protein BV378_20740 [Nostoc sp. RF31YmG]